MTKVIVRSGDQYHTFEFDTIAGANLFYTIALSVMELKGEELMLTDENDGVIMKTDIQQ